MADVDPTAIVPYHDPFDHHIRTIENFLMSDDDNPPTLNFSDFPNYDNLSINPSPGAGNQEDAQEITDPNDPFTDSFVWDFLDNHRIEEEDLQPDPSGRRNVGDHQDEENCTTSTNANSNHNLNDFGNPIRLSVWPMQTPPYTCSCCQVLREITHTNGIDVMKLEVHGRLGMMICHAVLEKYTVDLGTNKNHEYKMFDFCKESISKVKQFLEEYCEERKTSGYIMLQDPLSIFYEALCVGLDWEDTAMDVDDYLPLDFTGEWQMNYQREAESSGGGHINRSALAMQRERTGKLKMRDFIKYFHFPIDVAAKKIQVCPTVMKKICRKHGLSRWPHRKIKSIERKISIRAKGLTSVDAEERGRAQADIEKLQQEIANIYAKFNS